MHDLNADQNAESVVSGSPLDMDDFSAGAAGMGDEAAAKPRRSLRVIVIVAIALVLVAGWWLLRGGEAPMAAPPLATVTVAEPLEREITEWDSYIGRFEASNSVEIRPQVSGQVTRVHFRDGQYVQRGAPLFTIDQRPYRAALAEANARVASAQSALALSRSNFARAERLIEADAIAATEIDRLRAEVSAGQASLAAAQAQARSRSLDMEFTIVRAPISGRVSDRRVDAGNLVAAGSGPSASLLTTINALDPIYFTFEGSEGLYLKSRRQGLDSAALVDIRLQDEADYQWHGQLDFTDNALDPQSGTIRGRAVIANPQQFLTPGMFGNMRLASGGTVQALLVPDTAVQTDQTRKLLLVVDGEGKVSAREVDLGPLVGGLRVVRSGISSTDLVVIEGTQMAYPGSQVNPQRGAITQPEQADGEPPLGAPDTAPAGEASFVN